MNVDPELERHFAQEIVRKLRAAGYTAYWAGGCVRDELLGLVPKDFDVATSAQPDQVRELFGRRRTLAIGAAFGVITVLGPPGTRQIEVATFREDLGYSDGRHPDQVAFSTPEMDAQRRDFTINGLFYDPAERQVIDFVGGRDDLARGLVRAIGEPRARFAEDKLRMLRAVRFAATFQFQLDPATLTAIREMASELGVVSAERIGMEMRRMLTHPTRGYALELLAHSGLLSEVLPEVERLRAQSSETWSATIRAVRALAKSGAPTIPEEAEYSAPNHHLELSLVLAAVLHQTGTGALATTVGERWRLTSKETSQAAWLLDHYRSLGEAQTMPWPRLQRLLIAPDRTSLVALYEAIAGPTAEMEYCRQKLALPEAELNPQPLVTGDDLIAHGVRPGKQFRVLLDAVRDAQLDRQIETKQQALALVDRLQAESGEN